MNAAVREGAILRNPCIIPGAGTDRPKDRPTATPAQIAALVDAITPRDRAAVLVAAWADFAAAKSSDFIGKTSTSRQA